MLQLQSYMKCEEGFTSRKKIVSLEILYKTISSCAMSLCDEVKTQPGNSVKLILLGQCCAVHCTHYFGFTCFQLVWFALLFVFILYVKYIPLLLSKYISLKQLHQEETEKVQI